MPTYSQTPLRLGMSPDDVRKEYASVDSSFYQGKIQMSRREDIYGLDGTWHYFFTDQKLSSFTYSKYYQDDQLTPANFDRCLAAIDRLSADYTRWYGKPDESKLGKTTFVNPYMEHHYGYEVKEFSWKNYEGMSIRMLFKFFGSKGQYFLLFEVEYESAGKRG